MGYFVTMNVERKVVDKDNRLLEFKYLHGGEYVATVRIDLINHSFEVIDGGFDHLPIPDDEVLSGKNREDLVLRDIVKSAAHWMEHVWSNEQ